MLSCKDKKIRKSRKSCFLESCRYAILRRVWQALALSSDSQIYIILHLHCSHFMLYILDFYCIAFTFRDIKNPWPCALTLSAPCLVDLHSALIPFTLTLSQIFPTRYYHKCCSASTHPHDIVTWCFPTQLLSFQAKLLNLTPVNSFL